MNYRTTNSQSEYITDLYTVQGHLHFASERKGIALQYHELGMNVIPINDKGGGCTWTEWQEARQIESDLDAMPWHLEAMACVNGIGDWHSFDFDEAKSFKCVMDVLVSMGLPLKYPWIVNTRRGYHIWFRCNESVSIQGQNKSKYTGYPPEPTFDHVELRLARHITVLPPSPNKDWRYHTIPSEPPAYVSAAAIERGFLAVAALPEKSPPESKPGSNGSTPTYIRNPLGHAHKAIQAELELLRTCDVGNRNNGLNSSTFNIEQLIETDNLSRSQAEEVRACVRDILLQKGLSSNEIEDTMKSATNGAQAHPRSDRTSTAYPHTDLGNAERFAAQHGPDARYCYSIASWLIWNGKHWEKDEGGLAERKAKATVRAIAGEASLVGEENSKEFQAVLKHALKSEAKTSIRNMLALAQSELPMKREDLDTDQWLLNCENGTLNLHTGTLYPHTRGDYITRALAIPYHAYATCPRWETFLAQCFPGSPELVTFMQRAMGYALTGDVSEQCLFLLHGMGDNGKSTMLETLHTVMGEYSQITGFSTFLEQRNENVRNDIARMDGKRLVIAKEADKGKRLAEALVKDLTGGDSISARFLHQEYFEFIPRFKLFLAANYKPEIRGMDRGIWRRIRLIPFTRQFSDDEKDTHLKEKLLEEAPGILAWCVRGCLDWQRYGLGVPKAISEATEKYHDEMDVLGTFIDEYYQAGGSTVFTDMYALYVQWNENAKLHPITKPAFQQRMRERGFETKPGTANKLYLIGLSKRAVS